jgi:hypothetical protein
MIPRRKNLCKCGCGQSCNKQYVHNHHGRKSTRYVVDGNGCWVWQLSTFKNTGYGKLEVQGKTLYAHRYYYQLAVGDIPKGKELDHKCKNILCVNPDHLEPVTHPTNVRRGSLTKLTSEDVSRIREQYAEGESQYKIAANFSISQGHVSDIVNGKRWLDDTSP